MDKRKKSIFIIGSVVISIVSLILLYFVLIVTGVIQFRENSLTVTPHNISKKFEQGQVMAYKPYADDGTPNFTITGKIEEGHDYEVVGYSGTNDELGSKSSSIVIRIFDKNNPTIDVTKNYKITYETGLLTFYASEIIFDSHDAEKYYDGTPLKGSPSMIVHKGTPEPGHTIRYECNAEITYPGEVDNKFSVSIVNENGHDVTDYYKITYDKIGKLIVKKSELKVESFGAIKPYDGTPLTNDTEPTVTGVISDKHQIFENRAVGTITDVGIRSNTIKFKITDKETGEDVTSYYDIEKIEGDLIVIPLSDMPSLREFYDKMNNKELFKVNSTETGSVYLRKNSFSNYTGTINWDNTGLNNYEISGVNPLLYTNNAIKQLNLPSSVITIKMNSQLYVDYLFPYYTVDTFLSENSIVYTENDIDYELTANEYNEILYSLNYVNFQKLTEQQLLQLSTITHSDTNYDNFVLNNYLSLPTETKSKMLEIANANNITSFDLNSSIIDNYAKILEIAKFIQSSAEYDLSSDYSNINDVATYFFEYKKGICSHFSTAGVAFFRALGLPARYTTGFLVDVFENQDITVIGYNAHAWVEVYLSGFGWIQIEVTGGFGNGTGEGEEQVQLPPNLPPIVLGDITSDYTGEAVNYTQEYLNVIAEDYQKMLSVYGEVTVTIEKGEGLTNVGKLEKPDVEYQVTINGIDATEKVAVFGTIEVLQKNVTINLSDVDNKVTWDNQQHTLANPLLEKLVENAIKTTIDKDYTVNVSGTLKQSGVGETPTETGLVQDVTYVIYDEDGNEVQNNFKFEYTGSFIQKASLKVNLQVEESEDDPTVEDDTSLLSIVYRSKIKTASLLNNSLEEPKIYSLKFSSATGLLYKTYDGKIINFSIDEESVESEVKRIAVKISTNSANAGIYDVSSLDIKVYDMSVEGEEGLEINGNNFDLTLQINGTNCNGAKIYKRTINYALNESEGTFKGSNFVFDESNVDILGLVEGEEFKVSTNSDVGTYSNNNEEDYYKFSYLVTNNKNDVTSNYNINTNSTFTINKLNILYEIDNSLNTQTFNGKNFAISSQDSIIMNQPLSDGLVYKISTNDSNVGDYQGENLIAKLYYNGVEVDEKNYDDSISNSLILKIEKLYINVNLENIVNNEKTFDGEVFTLSNENGGLNLDLSEGLNLTISTNDYNVNEYDVTQLLYSFTYNNEPINENNYEVTISEDIILYINKLQIVLGENTFSKIFDGEAFIVNSIENAIKVNPNVLNKYVLVFTTNSIDSGEYHLNDCVVNLLNFNTLEIISTQNYEIIDNENFILTIEKRELYVKYLKDSKYFDDKVFTLTSVSDLIVSTNSNVENNDGLINNDVLTIKTVDKIAKLYTYINQEITYEFSNNENNYVINESTLLPLLINDCQITIKTNSYTWTYDNTEHYRGQDELLSQDIEVQEGHTYTFEKYGKEYQTDLEYSKDYLLINAGEYLNVFKIVIRNESGEDVTELYSVLYEYGTILIEKIELSVTTNSETKIYDGNVLNGQILSSSGNILESDIIDGYTLDTCITASTLDKIGTIVNEPIYLIKENKKCNYNITKNVGTLTIKGQIKLETNSNVKFYDGTPLTSGGSILEQHLPQSYDVHFEIIGSQTEVGESKNTYILTIYDTENNNKIVYSNNEETLFKNPSIQVIELVGDLIVLDNNVVIVTGSSSKVYDTYILENTEIYFKNELYNEYFNIASVTFGERYSEIGAYKNDVTSLVITDKQDNVVENLNITYEEGTLIIYEDVYFEINGAEKIYDGKHLTCSEVNVIKNFHINYAQDYVVEITPIGSQTEIGYCYNNFNLTLKYQNNVIYSVKYDIQTNSYITEIDDGRVNLSINFADVDDYILLSNENAYIKINCILNKLVVKSNDSVTITTNSNEKAFDGTPLTDSGYIIKFNNNENDELFNNFEFSVLVGGSQTQIGVSPNYIKELEIIYKNEIVYKYSNESGLIVDLGYFPIEIIEGELAVYDRDAGGDTESDVDGNTELFRVFSQKNDNVYLRGNSYSNYTGTCTWNNDNLQNYSLASIENNPLLYLNSILSNSNYNNENYLNNVIIKMNSNNYVQSLMPYFAKNLDNEIISNKEYDIDYKLEANNNGEIIYSNDYLKWSKDIDFTNLTPIHNDSYYEFTKSNYLALPTATSEYLLNFAVNNSTLSSLLVNGNLYNESDEITQKLAKINDLAKFVSTYGVYDENMVDLYKDKQDYAVSFFEEIRGGVCRHFATAGVALYRALGVPARYVSGFLATVNASDVEGTPVLAKQKHGWVEVYVNGYGWVNVEVTGSGANLGGVPGVGGFGFMNSDGGEDVIEKPIVVITPKNYQKVYDGTPIDVPTDFYTHNLPSGYTIENVFAQRVGDGINVGKYDYVINLDSAVIYDIEGNDVTQKFEILIQENAINSSGDTYKLAVLEVTKMQVSIYSNSENITYYGENTTLRGATKGSNISNEFTVLFGVGPERVHTEKLQYNNSTNEWEWVRTEVLEFIDGEWKFIKGDLISPANHNITSNVLRSPGKMYNHFAYTIVNSQGEDVTDNFRVSYEPGILEVEKIKVTIETLSKEVFWTGNEFKYSELDNKYTYTTNLSSKYADTSTQLLPTHQLVVSYNEIVQTDIGKYAITYLESPYILGLDNWQGYYEITSIYTDNALNYFYIKGYDVSINAIAQKYVYDSLEHSVEYNEYTFTDLTNKNAYFTFSASSKLLEGHKLVLNVISGGVGLNAGKYEYIYEYKIVDENGNDYTNTEIYTITANKGYLIIDRISLLIIAPTIDTNYGGEYGNVLGDSINNFDLDEQLATVEKPSSFYGEYLNIESALNYVNSLTYSAKTNAQLVGNSDIDEPITIETTIDNSTITIKKGESVLDLSNFDITTQNGNYKFSNSMRIYYTLNLKNYYKNYDGQSILTTERAKMQEEEDSIKSAIENEIASNPDLSALGLQVKVERVLFTDFININTVTSTLNVIILDSQGNEVQDTYLRLTGSNTYKAGIRKKEINVIGVGLEITFKKGSDGLYYKDGDTTGYTLTQISQMQFNGEFAVDSATQKYLDSNNFTLTATTTTKVGAGEVTNIIKNTKITNAQGENVTNNFNLSYTQNQIKISIIH